MSACKRPARSSRVWWSVAGWSALLTPTIDDSFSYKLRPDGLEHAEVTRRQVADYLAGFLNTLTPEEMAAAQVFLPGLRRVVQQKFVLDLAEEACGSHGHDLD